MTHRRAYKTGLWLLVGFFLVLFALPPLSQAEITQVQMGVDGMI